MRLTIKTSLSLASALAIAAASGPAWGQTTPDTDNANGQPQTENSQSARDAEDAIVVTGIRASLRDALQAKRANTGVTETISAKDIGVLPNVTIAEELARLPGITATRDRGNASQAVVRGLGPRLVLGLINGREVASSEPDRNVRWEIYPSEIVSAATVYKSQSADLIAGGVAATIDLRTLRPLDYSGPAFTVRAGALYNDGGKNIPDYSPWGFRGSAQYVGKLSDTLALALGGTYQRQHNGFESFQGWGYNTPNPGGNPPTLNGQPINAPWGAQTEVKALTESRWSGTAALQWRPNEHWDVDLDFLYSKVDIDERQYQQWYGRSNGWGDWGGTIGAPGDIYQTGSYTLVGNTIVAADLNNYSSVTNVLARYTEDKDVLVGGLNTRYSGDDWTAIFDFSYSKATRDNTWRAVATELYPQSTSFATGADRIPTLSVSSDPADLNAQVIPSYYPGLYDGPQRLDDDLGAISADFRHDLHDGFLTAVGGGIRYSHRVKSFAASTASVATKTGGNIAIPASMLGAFDVDSFDVPSLLYGDYDAIAAMALTIGTPVDNPTRAWRVREDDFEGYLKADFAGNLGAVPVSGNIGIRFLDVSTDSSANRATTSWNGTQNVTVIAPVQANAHYFRALPSLNLNFELNTDLKLRAGVARVISRPPLDELRASQSLSYYPPQLTGSAGNPYLKPFMATQGDLSLEYYFRKDALLALAGYYKRVDTNIGYTQTAVMVGSDTYTITGPANGDGGDIYGLELTFQTPFFFVPGLENFGVYANVAWVGSTVKELAPQSDPFDAVGLAEFTGQFDLYYSAHGVDVRFAVKHHSPFTVIYGWDASQLTRLESETILGASISFEVVHNVTLRLQANNLTNQAARFYWNNDPNQIARYERYGRSYLADVTFKF